MTRTMTIRCKFSHKKVHYFMRVVRACACMQVSEWVMGVLVGECVGVYLCGVVMVVLMLVVVVVRVCVVFVGD